MTWPHSPTRFMLTLSFQEVENDPSTPSVGSTPQWLQQADPFSDSAARVFCVK